ncbi:hypothetical protein ACFWGI_06805 [Streptomyces niveus]|uniref:hypothetical protein n=1 Tax=Streptomyces niveus TaxID=193462 RepID=UPI00364BDA07
MNLSSEILISEREFDTEDDAADLMRKLGSRLSTLQNEGALAGYQVVTLTEAGDFQDEDIDRALVESVTLGRLPAIYVNLTHRTGSLTMHDAELNSLLAKARMRLTLTCPPRTG